MRLSVPEPSACRGRSITWRAGYESALAGLGDSYSGPENSLAGIEWRDGHAVALQLLRELPEE
jgi:hypothetical protein